MAFEESNEAGNTRVAEIAGRDIKGAGERAAKRRDRDSGWSTKDEIAALEFMASDKPRSDAFGDRRVPTVEERRERIGTWLRTCNERRWPKWVDVYRCRLLAETLHENLN